MKVHKMIGIPKQEAHSFQQATSYACQFGTVFGWLWSYDWDDVTCKKCLRKRERMEELNEEVN